MGLLPAAEEIGAALAQAPCIYYERCGGCSLQHVNENFYRTWKTRRLKEILSRAGVTVKKFNDPIFLPQASRRRATLAAVKTTKGVVLGYNEERSHHIVDMNKCLVLEPALDEKIQAMRPYLASILPEKESCDITIQHVDGAFDIILTGPFKRDYEFLETTAEMAENLGLARISVRAKDTQEPEILIERHKVFKKSGVLSVALAPGAFLQASIAAEAALVKIISSYTVGAKRCADLFSGYGTFAGDILYNGATVHAVESDKHAVAALKKSGHKNLTAEQRNLFKKPLSAAELFGFDVAVFDPPRAGAQAQAEELAASKIPTIVAVSCNPETLARDVKILQNGGYSLQEITLVDQFAWSSHIECVAVLRL
jgi:23S rRNA (uracil1939-C5)-methyltransferase